MTPDSSTAHDALRAGTARRDITTAWPVMQGGYCGGTSAATDIMAEALAGTVCSAVRDAAPATHPLAAAAMTRIEVRAAGGELDDGSAQVRLQAARRVLAGALGDDFETRLAPGALWAAASAAVIAADLGEPDAAEHYETVTAGLERHAVDRALVAAHGLLAQLRGRLPA